MPHTKKSLDYFGTFLDSTSARSSKSGEDPSYLVLQALGQGAGTISEVATESGIALSSLMDLLERLRAFGLVDFEIEGDSAKRFRLTKEGTRSLASLRTHH